MITSGVRRSMTLGCAAALLVASSSLAQAQRPVASPRRTVVLSDTVEHSPFIPGGHWRPGPPAPVPEPAPDLPAGVASAVTDSAGYYARPNGMLLRADTSVYRLELRRDSLIIPLGVHTITVSESMLGGVPEWLVAESRTGSAIATYDSLYLHRVDLTPVRWTARNGLSQLAVSFTTDSMFAALQDYQGRGSFAAGVPPGALVTAGMVDRLLELLPLSAGYRSAASLVSIESGAPQALPATITVEGEERVAPSSSPIISQSAADSQAVAPRVIVDQVADCWLVVLRAGTLEKRYWVSKVPQRVVKTEQVTPAGVLREMRIPPNAL